MNWSDLAHFRAADLAAPRLGAFCSRGASFHALVKRLAAKTPEPGTGVLALLLFSDLVDMFMLEICGENKKRSSEYLYTYDSSFVYFNAKLHSRASNSDMPFCYIIPTRYPNTVNFGHYFREFFNIIVGQSKCNTRSVPLPNWSFNCRRASWSLHTKGEEIMKKIIILGCL